MSDDYPTDEQLARISSEPNPLKALTLVRAAWIEAYGTITEQLTEHERALAVLHPKPDSRYLRLSTGGWSGNESIIDALKQNRIAWLWTWRLSACGGLHIFEYREAP